MMNRSHGNKFLMNSILTPINITLELMPNADKCGTIISDPTSPKINGLLQKTYCFLALLKRKVDAGQGLPNIFKEHATST